MRARIRLAALAAGGFGLCLTAAAAADPATELRSFVERRQFEARVGLREVSRDAERRVAEQQLRRSGSPAVLAGYRRRLAAEDARDALVNRHEARQLSWSRGGPAPGAWWRSLGPATRRALLESSLELRRLDREVERERRLSALERESAEGGPGLFERFFGRRIGF